MDNPLLWLLLLIALFGGCGWAAFHYGHHVAGIACWVVAGLAGIAALLAGLFFAALAHVR